MLAALLMSASALRIEELDCMTFRVHEGDKSFMVDLLDLHVRGTCNGKCDCYEFGGIIVKRLDEGMGPSHLTRCKHIQACRDYVAGRFCDALHGKWKDKGVT